MTFYDYLPNIISLFLIFMSGLAERSYGKKIDDLQFKGPVMENNKEAIKNIALDWGNRQGFISSMVAAMFSVFSIFSRTQKSQQYTLVFIAIGVLVITFLITHYWILGRRPGEWQDVIIRKIPLGSTKSIKVTYSLVANIVLLVVNIILMGAIFIAGVNNSPSA